MGWATPSACPCGTNSGEVTSPESEVTSPRDRGAVLGYFLTRREILCVVPLVHAHTQKKKELPDTTIGHDPHILNM
jgi:hypothetical protein